MMFNPAFLEDLRERASRLAGMYERSRAAHDDLENAIADLLTAIDTCTDLGRLQAVRDALNEASFHPCWGGKRPRDTLDMLRAAIDEAFAHNAEAG